MGVLNEVVPPGDPFPGVFSKVHIRAQNYRWNFNYLSADILTNLNKISAINNYAFFITCVQYFSNSYGQVMLLNDISFNISNERKYRMIYSGFQIDLTEYKVSIIRIKH